MYNDIKDKRIIKEGLTFVAEVHWFDGGVVSAGRHMSMKAAQKALSKYPNDVFEGFDNPSGERALQHMDYVKEKQKIFAPRSRSKKETDYTRLYDKRC